MKFDANTLKQLRVYQEKHYIYYIKPTDITFKILNWIYIVSFLYSFIFSVISTISYYFRNFVVIEAAKDEAELLLSIKLSIIALIIFIFLLLTAFILNSFKKFLAGLILNATATIGLLLTFFKMMSDYIDLNGFLNYFLRHGISLLLLLIFGTIVSALGFRAYLKDKKAYIQFTDKDYKEQFND